MRKRSSIAALLTVLLVLALAAGARADDAHDYSFTIAGEGGSALGSPADVAVDNSSGPSAGAIYVADLPNSRVVKFGPTGAFVLMFGDGVNETTGGDVCSAGSGHVCGPGETASVYEEAHYPRFVAVDGSDGPSAGSVYVAYRGSDSVSKYTQFGDPIGGWNGGEAEFDDRITGLAVAPDGRLHVRVAPETATVYVFQEDGTQQSAIPLPDPPFGEEIEIDSSGNLYMPVNGALVKFTAAGEGLGEIPMEGGPQIAIDPSSDELYVRSSYGFGLFGEIVRLNTSCLWPECFGLELFGQGHLWPDGGGLAVDATTDTVYATNPGWEPERGVAVFRPPGVLPDVETGTALAEGDSAATVSGYVDPASSGAVIDCFAEYVTQDEYREGFFDQALTAPCSPPPSYPGIAGAPLTDLELDTEYRYRLVAVGSNGRSAGVTRELELVLPRATVEGAVKVDQTTALLTGVANPRWGEEIVGCRYLTVAESAFEATGFFGARELPCSPKPPYAERTDVIGPLFDLEPGTDYRYRLLVWNRVGADSSEGRFTTASPPAIHAPEGPYPPESEEDEDPPRSRDRGRSRRGPRRPVRCSKQACVRVLGGSARVRTWLSPRFPLSYGWLINVHKDGRQLEHSELVGGCRSTFHGQGILARLNACEGRFRLRYKGRGPFKVRWRVFEFCRCGDRSEKRLTTRRAAAGAFSLPSPG